MSAPSSGPRRYRCLTDIWRTLESSRSEGRPESRTNGIAHAKIAVGSSLNEECAAIFRPLGRDQLHRLGSVAFHRGPLGLPSGPDYAGRYGARARLPGRLELGLFFNLGYRRGPDDELA